MQIQPTQLDKHLASAALAPVYLVAGPEDLLRIEACDAIRAEARRQGFEREVFDVGPGFDWSAVEASFATLSLFSSRRLIELRLPTGKPGKEGAAVIERFCAGVPADLCLLVTAADWSKQHDAAWSRAIERAGVAVWTPPLRLHELPAWVGARLRRRGIELERTAQELFIERMEGNLLAAAQEIDKLALLAEGGRVDLDRLRSWVADSARFGVFGMTEAAMEGDAVRALRILRGLRAEGEAAVPIMNVLSGQVQVLVQVAEAVRCGSSLDRAMQDAGIWSSRQSQIRKTLQRIGQSGCQLLLARCAELDLASKGRGDEDPWRLMERILIALARRDALTWLRAA